MKASEKRCRSGLVRRIALVSLLMVHAVLLGTAQEPPAREPIRTVLQVPREAQLDVVKFRTGEEIKGAVLNPSLQVHTSFGSLSPLK